MILRIKSRWQIHNWVLMGITKSTMIWVALFVVLMLATYGSRFSHESFKIIHTNADVVLNSDRSANLNESFTYSGELSHGPTIKIESGGDDAKLNHVILKRIGYDKADKLHNIGERDDLDDLKSDLKAAKNCYGYCYEGDDLYVLINDPLKQDEKYTVAVNVTESKIISKQGVIRWNVLGSANQVNLGSVNVHIKNNSLQNVHSFYLQTMNGVVAYGQKLNDINLKIKHYGKDDHLDLRTNLPYAKAVVLTRMLHFWIGFGFNWFILFLLIVLYIVYARKQLLGSSMAISDTIFDDLPRAIYLTSAEYDKNLVAGLLTKRVLNRDLGIKYYKKTDLEKKVLDAYNNASDHDEVSSQKLRMTRSNFYREFPFYNSTTVLGIKNVFWNLMRMIIVVVILMLIPGLKFSNTLNVANLILIAFVLLMFIDFHNQLSFSFRNLADEMERYRLIRLANGLMDIDEIRKLNLKDAGLWVDLISWAVGIGLNSAIISELSKRGYDLGFFNDPELATKAYDSFSTDLSFNYDYGSPSDLSDNGGGSFGGGDAGGGSGAGGW